MRDPNRIKPLLAALESKWNDYPDWRFGQLVYNVLCLLPSVTKPNASFEELVFFVEDDVWKELLDA